MTCDMSGHLSGDPRPTAPLGRHSVVRAGCHRMCSPDPHRTPPMDGGGESQFAFSYGSRDGGDGLAVERAATAGRTCRLFPAGGRVVHGDRHYCGPIARLAPVVRISRVDDAGDGMDVRRHERLLVVRPIERAAECRDVRHARGCDERTGKRRSAPMVLRGELAGCRHFRDRCSFLDRQVLDHRAGARNIPPSVVGGSRSGGTRSRHGRPVPRWAIRDLSLWSEAEQVANQRRCVAPTQRYLVTSRQSIPTAHTSRGLRSNTGPVARVNRARQ